MFEEDYILRKRFIYIDDISFVFLIHYLEWNT